MKLNNKKFVNNYILTISKKAFQYQEKMILKISKFIILLINKRYNQIYYFKNEPVNKPNPVYIEEIQTSFIKNR